MKQVIKHKDYILKKITMCKHKKMFIFKDGWSSNFSGLNIHSFVVK
jgi:hypothetical protein